MGIKKWIPFGHVGANLIYIIAHFSTFKQWAFLLMMLILIFVLVIWKCRHVNVSMEMLLKLVAVFGPVIRTTVSAPRSVGVDLHAEQRCYWLIFIYGYLPFSFSSIMGLTKPLWTNCFSKFECRRECCNQCFMQLQKIRKLLPPLLRWDAIPVNAAVRNIIHFLIASDIITITQYP